MSRRHAGEDPEFRSDSFLDIIANIVGILIILIVVAGVKVARQPPAVPESPAADVIAAEAVAPSPEGAAESGGPEFAHLLTSGHLALLRAESERETQAAVRLERDAAELDQQAGAIAARISQVQGELVGLNATIASQHQNAARARSGQAKLQDEAQRLRTAVQTFQTQSRVAETRQQALSEAVLTVYRRQELANTELQEIGLATRQLQEVIEEQQAEAVADADRLVHRLSPVARTENGQEIHFRLSDGRISWVPLEPLLEGLKRQVSNRGGLIRRFGRYDGVCGPVGGYSMKYTVERHTPSPLDNLNGVSSGFRISVSRWTVSPTGTLRAETVDEALTFGSRFRQIAEAADPDATMTVWLYSGDFEHFGRVREFGHGLGLRVAARPLPDGSEITGSPAGSRSSAQ